MRVVEQTGATNVVAGVSGTMLDGTVVTTGRYGDALSGSSQSQLRVFDVQSQAVINRESDIALTTGNSYFAALAVHNVTAVPRLPVDVSHPRWVLDHNRCILCSRCVRVCDEIEGAHVWDIAARGINSMLVAELNLPWGEAPSCTNCGKCVQVCPTGALVEKGLAVEEMTKRNSVMCRDGRNEAMSGSGDAASVMRVQTFSATARPSNPWGRINRTRIRMTKT